MDVEFSIEYQLGESCCFWGGIWYRWLIQRSLLWIPSLSKAQQREWPATCHRRQARCHGPRGGHRRSHIQTPARQVDVAPRTPNLYPEEMVGLYIVVVVQIASETNMTMHKPKAAAIGSDRWRNPEEDRLNNESYRLHSYGRETNVCAI